MSNTPITDAITRTFADDAAATQALAQTGFGGGLEGLGTKIGNSIPLWYADAQNYISNVAENPLMAAPPLLGLAAVGTVIAGTPPALYHAKKNLTSEPHDLVVGQREQKFYDWFSMPVWIKWSDRCHHTQLIGPPGTGKTTVLIPWIIQDLRAGRTVVIVQIYGDLAGSAREYGEAIGAEVLEFNVSKPGKLKLNPLVGENTEDVAERAASAVRGAVSNHPHYETIAEDVTRNIVTLVRRYAAHKGYAENDADISLINTLLNDRALLEKVLDVKRPLDDNGKATGEIKVNAPWLDYFVCTWFEQEYLKWSEQTLQNNLSEVGMFFRRLVNRTPVREAMCPRPGDATLDLFGELRKSADRSKSDSSKSKDARNANDGDEAASRGQLIIINAPTDPDAAGAQPARYIAYWALKIIQDATMMRGKGDHPLAVYLDELPTLLGHGHGAEVKAFIDWLANVRKCNVAVVVAYQYYDQVPDEVAKSLDANARNKIIKGGISDEDIRKVMRLTTDEQQVESETLSHTALGPDHVSSRNRRKQEKATFTYRDIKGMGRSECIWMPTRNGKDRDPIKLTVKQAKPPDHYRKRRERAEAAEKAREHRAARARVRRREYSPGKWFRRNSETANTKTTATRREEEEEDS